MAEVAKGDQVGRPAYRQAGALFYDIYLRNKKYKVVFARMAELVDALGSGPSWCKPVGVRVPLRALKKIVIYL